MYTYKAKVVRVLDGDSVSALIDLGFRISFEIRVRLSGIDTPEIRGVERPQGLISKKRLEELVLDKEVILKTQKDKQEKFGRWLGELYIPNQQISVNELLIQEGLAKPY